MATTLKSRTKKVKHTRTETEIQNRLYWFLYRKSHESVAPNVYLYEWESDMFSVTKAGYAHEYEIKISLSDFRADAGKTARHQILGTGTRELTEQEQLRREQFKSVPRHWIHNRIEEIKKPQPRPNYFWYICPWEIIPVDQIPTHAGLMWLHDQGYIETIKDAPLLHKEKVTEAIIKKVDTSFRFKYWRQRTGE
jgi:hypothetical protein